jgi:hypothetical protein
MVDGVKKWLTTVNNYWTIKWLMVVNNGYKRYIVINIVVDSGEWWLTAVNN